MSEADLIDFFLLVDVDPKLRRVECADPENIINAYRGAVTDQYPADTPELALPGQVASFCFPRGVRFVTSQLSPTSHSFVLTELDGSRVYGTCLIFYEPLWDSLKKLLALKQSAEPFYTPRALCVLSHHPLLLTQRKWLRAFYETVFSGTKSLFPAERYIHTLVDDASIPALGTSSLIKVGTHNIVIPTPPPRDGLPLLDLSPRALFESLGLRTIIDVISCLLTEVKVVLVAPEFSTLVYCAETLLSLMYPFQWPFTYIPVLADAILDVLAAPHPYFAGVHTAAIDRVREFLYEVGGGALVNIASGTIEYVGMNPPVSIPQQEVDFLSSGLRPYLSPSAVCSDAAFAEPAATLDDPGYADAVRRCFLTLFVRLIGGYNSCILEMYDGEHHSIVFNKATFLDQKPRAFHPFLTSLLSTQIIITFLEQYWCSGSGAFHVAAGTPSATLLAKAKLGTPETARSAASRDDTESAVNAKDSCGDHGPDGPAVTHSPGPAHGHSSPHSSPHAQSARGDHGRPSPKMPSSPGKQQPHSWLPWNKSGQLEVGSVFSPNVQDLRGRTFRYSSFPRKLDLSLFGKRKADPRRKRRSRDFGDDAGIVTDIPNVIISHNTSMEDDVIKYEVEASRSTSDEEEEQVMLQMLEKMINCSMDKIGSALTADELQRFKGAMRSDYLRRRFARALSQEHNPSVISAAAFEPLGQVVIVAVDECEKTGDFRCAKALMSVSSKLNSRSEKGVPSFILECFLKESPIWRDLMFWEFTLREHLYYEHRRTMSTPSSPCASATSATSADEGSDRKSFMQSPRSFLRSRRASSIYGYGQPATRPVNTPAHHTPMVGLGLLSGAYGPTTPMVPHPSPSPDVGLVVPPQRPTPMLVFQCISAVVQSMILTGVDEAVVRDFVIRMWDAYCGDDVDEDDSLDGSFHARAKRSAGVRSLDDEAPDVKPVRRRRKRSELFADQVHSGSPKLEKRDSSESGESFRSVLPVLVAKLYHLHEVSKMDTGPVSRSPQSDSSALPPIAECEPSPHASSAPATPAGDTTSTSPVPLPRGIENQGATHTHAVSNEASDWDSTVTATWRNLKARMSVLATKSQTSIGGKMRSMMSTDPSSKGDNPDSDSARLFTANSSAKLDPKVNKGESEGNDGSSDSSGYDEACHSGEGCEG
eukprot:Rmarinus@m.9284